MNPRKGRAGAGFTLIELLVVVLIIGVLSAIAVPQYFRVVEKGKAGEALTTLDEIRGGQERYVAKTGTYCTAAFSVCTAWDMTIPSQKYFIVNNPTAGAGSPSWEITLTRNGTPVVYGAYVVTYDVEPNLQPNITCSNTNCSSDLMPQ